MTQAPPSTFPLLSSQDIARQLIRFALHRAAEKTEVPYAELLKMPPGQRRDYHDDITVVVFFFDHEAMKRQSQKNNNWKKVGQHAEGMGGGAVAMPAKRLLFCTVPGKQDSFTSIPRVTSERFCTRFVKLQKPRRHGCTREEGPSCKGRFCSCA